MKVQKCCNCTFYSAYYKQWASGYGKMETGYCQKHNATQKRYHACEDFKSNEQKEVRREKMRFDALDQALQSINDIAHILKENDKKE